MTRRMPFALLQTSPSGRLGNLTTPHGTIETPFFLPVATGGAMRGVRHEDILALGAQAMLCNTYHLHLRPGEQVINDAGGLHAFIGWPKPILTDSGGFQVFSLRDCRSVTDDGVTFRSHLDGSRCFLGPREAMEIQHKLGADMIMCLDVCPPSTAKRSEIVVAVERTLRWAEECKRWHEELYGRIPQGDILFPLLFAIVQGGLERDLREKCAQELVAMEFDGYAIGGLAVGEGEADMYEILDVVCPLLPVNKPRYLMGVGKLSQIPRCIAKGIDMFDCVLPMREGRHGTLYLSDGTHIRITKQEYLSDHTPIDAHSPALSSRQYSRAYLCHLLRSGERLGETLACLQNMAVTLNLFQKLREGIAQVKEPPLPAGDGEASSSEQG
ncbi:hypothetical protein A3H22_04545 [Candidatus Peribacteria bacterium RIFCSPLOWO2_12_FULL_55_15]|nr:MAG: hypothetical protein A2789_01960 [Candidatus Peribacteria bacterium RIFCSPHIGHO2_01_FULL_54_22]OGJ62329.1 MAG: hypothetical protein A3D12_02215 [Candidatus Peribacteria bacterium RIFCSPHIGHO2_02_FULL_55_24]OGJ67702.1 MAG: hypothetical protein A2947_03215 [Candidatus Peribacteria bacterium RIFCSPLOWO2_01_FULL_54_110]OGJ68911.1 MAG: hypothetical protein A3H90_02055 [Candidatus Peribacteria bacterium RIFCSPLOWO2_02_FULL_55_36]OGJ71089.1 MAG: hypothetical protein A3H22_04545 [Candidatus Per